MDRSVLERKSVPELRDIASALQMTGTTKLRKAELIDAIISQGSADADADASKAVTSGDSEDTDEVGADDDDSDDDDSDDDDSDDDDSDDDDSDDDDSGDVEDGGRGRSRRTRTRSRESSRRPSGDSDDDGNSDDDSSGRANRGRRERRPGSDGDTVESAGGSRDRGNNGRGSKDGGNGQGRNDGSKSDGGRNKQSGRNSEQDAGNEGGRNKNRGGKGNNRSEDDPGEVRAGVLDILPEGYGFLRTTGYLPGERDVYVSQGQIRKQRLRRGDVVQGPIRQQRSNEKVPALHHVERVNLEELESGQVADRPDFDDLPSIPLSNRIDLSSADSITVRAIDLVAPQADGQRTVIKVPPSIDGASLLVDLAADLAQARPESHLMLLTVDARPEVVDVAASAVNGEIIASTFEQPAEDHTQIAELAIERARRLVELGHDVIVLIDSISRLARAYGVAGATGGRTVAPDVEAAALYPPKQLLAAAKATDGHGSLTIIATLLTDTGSAYDEVVEREFTRIANSTVVVDAGLVTQGVEPAVSVLESHTYLASSVESDDRATAVADLRRSVRTSSSDESTMEIMDRLRATLSGGTGGDR